MRMGGIGSLYLPRRRNAPGKRDRTKRGRELRIENASGGYVFEGAVGWGGGGGIRTRSGNRFWKVPRLMSNRKGKE